MDATQNTPTPEATMKINKTNARTSYAAKRAEIADLIKTLNKALDDDAKEILANGNRVDWGHVGDVEQVAEYLRNAVSFITGAEE